MTLAIDNHSVVNERLQRDIDVLKRARQQVIVLRQLLQEYGADLSYEFASPAAKIDRELAACLLRRELEQDA